MTPRTKTLYAFGDTPAAKLVKAYRHLGVAPDAPNSLVSRVYREKARALHPDRHPQADAAERRRLTDEMAVLNVMLEIIREARSEAEPKSPEPRDEL